MTDLNNYSTHNIKRFNMNNKIFIPKGRLAEDDAALKAKREALKKKLLEGGKITLKNNGSVTDDKGADSTISIPKGKLAANQWYERDPELLEMEKIVVFQNACREKQKSQNRVYRRYDGVRGGREYVFRV